MKSEKQHENAVRQEVPDYVQRYVKTYFDWREKLPCWGRKIDISGRDIIIPAVAVIAVGLIYGLALPANFLSFGILGVIGMAVLAVYTLILYRIPIHKEGGDRYSLKEGDRRNQKVNLKEIWAAPLSAYGVNPCDEKTVEYFKSVMRNRGKGKRRAMFLSWIAPLSAFVIGMVFIALEIEIVAEIIFPIAYYIALLLILNFRNLLFVQIYMLTGIRFFACPKCHIVDANGYALAETSRREYDFDTVVKSHTGERTVGTVYDANGEKVGSVTQSYTTQTCRRGTRHETLSTYYCVHCHNKVMSSSHYDTNVETYTV